MIRRNTDRKVAGYACLSRFGKAAPPVYAQTGPHTWDAAHCLPFGNETGFKMLYLLSLQIFDSIFLAPVRTKAQSRLTSPRRRSFGRTRRAIPSHLIPQAASVER